MPSWKTLIPTGITLVGGVGSVLEGVPWQIALPWTLLFMIVSLVGTGIRGLYQSWAKGEILHIREYQAQADQIKRLVEENVALKNENNELIRLAAQGTTIAKGLADTVVRQHP